MNVYHASKVAYFLLIHPQREAKLSSGINSLLFFAPAPCEKNNQQKVEMYKIDDNFYL